MLNIGKRLRQLREERHLSQGDIERETGLYRSYISRVEGGHMRPALATLERFAGALDVPLYWLFYTGTGHLPTPPVAPPSLFDLAEGKLSGPHAHFLAQLQGLWRQMTEPDRRLLLGVADRLAAAHSSAARRRAQTRLRRQESKSPTRRAARR